MEENKIEKVLTENFNNVLNSVGDYFEYIAEVRRTYLGEVERFNDNISPNNNKTVPMQFNMFKLVSFPDEERARLRDEMIKSIVNEIKIFNPKETKIVISTFLPRDNYNPVINFNFEFSYYKEINNKKRGTENC